VTRTEREAWRRQRRALADYDREPLPVSRRERSTRMSWLSWAWGVARERGLLRPERPDDPVALEGRRRFLKALSRVRG
jgi:hypothetical protein